MTIHRTWALRMNLRWACLCVCVPNTCVCSEHMCVCCSSGVSVSNKAGARVCFKNGCTFQSFIHVYVCVFPTFVPVSLFYTCLCVSVKKTCICVFQNWLHSVRAKARLFEKWHVLGEIFARSRDLKLSQNYYLTVLSGLFSESLVKIGMFILTSYSAMSHVAYMSWVMSPTIDMIILTSYSF